MASMILVLLFLIVVPGPAGAYRERTHTRLSLDAVNMSVLTSTALHTTLGGPSAQMPSDIPETVATANVAEDAGSRPANHFFNPLTGEGFTYWPGGKPAPFWALGALVDDSGTVVVHEEDGPFGEPRLSFRSARSDLYETLTSAAAVSRGKRALEMVQLLGHAIHIVQDMAQPQHVRNDNHFEVPFLPPHAPFRFEHGSVYEHWVEENIDSIHTTLQDYPIVRLRRPQDYWTVFYDHGLTAFANNNGLADFDNHNFVSIGTNFRHDPSVIRPIPGIPVPAEILPAPGFPKPNGVGATIVRGTWSGGLFSAPFPLGDSAALDGSIIYYVGTPIVDTLSGPIPSGFNDYTSTMAMLDPDLASVCDATASCDNARFTLNEANYNAAASFLLPRARAYSAGLIDYFFRGVVQNAQPALRLNLTTFGNATYASITNATGEPLHGGKLKVFYDQAGTFGTSRQWLGEKTMDIGAGQTEYVTQDKINWPVLWTRQRADGGAIVFVYVGSMGAEHAPVGADGSEYAVAGRVCTCPPQVDVNNPNDPQLECFKFCCQYLSFTNGDPGVPGDGRTVQPDSVGYLNLYPPLEGSVLTDGFTLTVFTSAPAMGAFFEARGASDAPCSAFGTCVYPYANFIGQPVEGTITVNNVKGYYGRSPASAIITSDTCSCSPDDAYALDDLLNVFPCFGACTDGSCYCNGPRAPIDAVALCRDENKLPE